MEVYCIINKTVKLAEPTGKSQLQQPLAYDNTLAHSLRVTVLKEDGTPEVMDGVSVVASFMRADNKTVSPILGTVAGNVAEVVLPASCYVVPGRFKCTVNLSKLADPTGVSVFSTASNYVVGDLVAYGGIVFRFIADHSAGAWTGEDAVVEASAARTALWVEGYVERNISNDLIDPGTPVGNIPQVIANANAAAQSATTAAAAAYDAAQEAGAYADSIAPDYADLEFPILAWEQLCWHEGGLYINAVDIVSAETWTNAHWVAADVSYALNRRVSTADVATVAETKTYLGI